MKYLVIIPLFLFNCAIVSLEPWTEEDERRWQASQQGRKTNSDRQPEQDKTAGSMDKKEGTPDTQEYQNPPDSIGYNKEIRLLEQELLEKQESGDDQ